MAIYLAFERPLVRNRGKEFGQKQKELAKQRGVGEDLPECCDKCCQSHFSFAFYVATDVVEGQGTNSHPGAKIILASRGYL